MFTCNDLLIFILYIVFLLETSEVSPQKRHKKHKHKKHKKRKVTHNDNDGFNDVATETEKKKTFRVKIKKDDEKG